jgi:hypothetical protein
MRAAGFLVQGGAGLMRGVEFHLVADRRGEGEARNERQEKGQKEGSTKQDAEGDTTDREVNHVIASLWVPAWWWCVT